MRFNIRQIEIENFRSIQQKVTVAIRPGLFSVEGINNDEDNSGNGSGKSSILSALYWCLTGNALTNEALADDIVNVKTGKNCKVSLYIDSDQGDIKITRTRKDSEFGNNLFLEIADQDLTCHKVADTQERINQLLKIPFELLHSTIIMTHDIKSAFSELSPQQRVQTLEAIRDYSVWDKVRDEANKDIKIYNKEIQELNLELSNRNGRKATYEKMLESAGENYKVLVKSFDETELDNKIKSLKDANDKINAEIETLDNQIKELNTEIENKTDKSLQQSLNGIVDTANNIKLTLQKTEYERKEKVKDITTIDAWFKNDKCPTCGHLLDRTEEEKSAKSSQREKLEEQLKLVDENITKLNNDITVKRQEWAQVNSQLQANEKIVVDFRKKLMENNNMVNELKSKVLANTRELAELELTKKNHSYQVDKLASDIASCENEIKVVVAESTILSEKLKSLENKKQLSDYFYKLLGSKGELRPYLLSNDIKYLNHCMQKYVHTFFKNTEIELCLEGANIDILINSNGIQKKVTSLSGGEKKRLNIAIQLGLYDLIQATSQVSFNILWLDEIESELDQTGVNQLIEIIEDKNNEAESVYWITNHPTVKENIQDKIICTKSLGVTTIEER